jgi:beta-lactamase regulating signal transducer with metallopeptidase domain
MMNQATNQTVNQVWNTLEGILDAIWGLAATGLIHGTILAALTALAGATLLRRASPALLAALWTVVLLKFVIPLGPALPVSLSGLFEAMLAGADAGTGTDVGVAAVQAHASTRSTGAVLWLLAQAGLLGAYLGLVLWLLGRRVAGLRAVRRWAESGQPAGEAMLAAVAQAAHRLGLRRLPVVRVHQTATTPQVVGLWRPILVVPTWLPARHDHMTAALLHELAHLRRRDTWVHGLQLVVGTLLCAWPVVHWVNRRIAMYREMACDQWALACGPLEAGGYARMLVGFARRMIPAADEPVQGASMALLGGRKQIEHRVDALLRGRARPRLGRVSAAVLAVWALLSLGSTRRAEAGHGVPECVLTADMIAQLLAHFPEADRDGDGVLTREEMCAHRDRMQRVLQPGGGAASADLDALADRDGDGALSAGEIEEFKTSWDAMGLPDCAACNCSVATAPESTSSLAPVELKICIDEEE